MNTSIQSSDQNRAGDDSGRGRDRSVVAPPGFRLASVWVVWMLSTTFVACGGSDGTDGPGENDRPDVDELPYARNVIAFEPGEGSGYGEEDIPEVVTGPPGSEGTSQGSKTVLSLGNGGEIELGFGPRRIVDGPGADFIVFENAFYVGGDEETPYQELGRVEVSQHGETWHAFPCDTEAAEPGRWPGCAGWRPVKSFDPYEVVPLDPEVTGGDPFDLADLDLESASYVRIVGVSDRGTPPKVGFDLDAVGIVSSGG